MMRQGTWKIIKLNMWIAREEVPASIVMMLLAALLSGQRIAALRGWSYLWRLRHLLFGKDAV